jgi:hypothetical protein
MASPRCAHYQLAHVAIRSVVFKNPYDFMSLMASDKALEVLSSLLEQVGEHCAGEELLELNELAIHRTRVLGSPCLIVELPSAEVPPEAHFVGVWLTANDGPETGQVRYFTLEAADEQSPTAPCWASGAALATTLSTARVPSRHSKRSSKPLPRSLRATTRRSRLTST